MIKCQYCNKKFKTNRNLSGHLGFCTERRKKLNLPDRKPCWSKGQTKENNVKLALISKKIKGRKMTWGDKVSKTRKEKIKLGLIKTWNKGLTKETDARVKTYSIKGSIIRSSEEYNNRRKKWLKEIGEEGRKKRWATYGNAGHKQSEDSIKKNKESNSKTISNKIINGEIKQNGWSNHSYYDFKNNGRQYYDSTYELERMKWLDKNGYIFKKNPFRIPYFFEGNQHYYIPDLLVIDYENSNIYVEEIKSSFTLNNELEKNKAKFEAAKIYCQNLGIEFHVFNKNEYDILDNVEFDEIETIEEVGDDDFYGFCSPLHKNIIIDDVIHHNSGKDTIAYLCSLYVVYVLLCCKNPLSLFKGVTADYLDILNVAYNHRQAVDVFMAKLVLAVKNWKWLKNRYRFVDSGRSTKDDKKYETDFVVNIKQDKIVFPKYIRAIAKCSQQDAAEGTNLLVWIADEFSAFSDKNSKSNAMEMFNTLRTSSTTRFQNYGKGFVISFTRYKNDPILKLIDLYKDDINTYTDIASTFEVKPKSAFKGEWGSWNGIEMPISFIADFERDPEGSKAKYLCQPPDAEDPWITETHLLEQSFHDRTPIFDFSESIVPSIGGNMIRKEIVRKNFNLPNTNFVLAGDLGRVNDRSALTLFHDESIYLPDGSVRKHYVQDFMLTWIPDKKGNKKVDFTNVEYLVKKIIFQYKISVVNVVFDNWQSSTLMDELANKGIIGKQYILKAEDFTRFKTLLYTDSIDLLKDSEVEQEMKRLINGNKGVPDHPESEHDDRFRAICLAITALEGFKGTDVVVTEDGIFLKGLKKKSSVSANGDNGQAIRTPGLHGENVDDEGIFNSLNIVNDLK